MPFRSKTTKQPLAAMQTEFGTPETRPLWTSSFGVASKTNKVVAAEIFISEKTVELYF